MRRTVFSLSCVLLVGCVHTPQPSVARQSQPLIRAPVLQAGCLLPSLQTIDVSKPGSIELLVKISDKGVPESTAVLKSSGEENQDFSFQQAAMACSFNPASSYIRSTGELKSIMGEYKLSYAWVAGQQFTGVARCFAPEYPSSARLQEEEAKVYVNFRLEAPNGPFEFRVTSSKPSRSLTEASLAATRRCLAHPEAQVGLSVGRWYRVPFDWRLE